MFRICFTLLFSVTLICASRAASPSADQIFPDTTKGFLSIRNLKDFDDQWQKTQFGRLMNDPLMQEFNKEVRKQLTERMEKTFGLTLDGIFSLSSGEVAFGMIVIANQTPGFVLTMDVTETRTQTDEYLATLTQKHIRASIKKSTETYKGQQITILTFPPPETPRMLENTKVDIKLEPKERKTHYMVQQNVLIASDQLPLLRLIADRIVDQSSATSLAEVEAYQVVMKRCIGDMPDGTLPIVSWYIEPLDYSEAIRGLLQSRNSTTQNRKDKPSVFTILKQQGFDAIQGIGGTVSVQTEAQESVYRTFVYTQKPYRLAMRMLNFPDGTNFVPPIWLPADLARCTTFYIDPLAIFDNFGVLFDALVMPGEEGVWRDILKGLEEDPHGPQINIREELIAHLDSRILGMSRYEKPITIKSESVVVAVELKTDHEPGMLEGIQKLFGTDPEMQGTQHNSYTIWHRIPMEGMLQPIEFDVPPLVEAPRGLVEPSVQPKKPQPNNQNQPPAFPDGGVVVAKGCLFVSTNMDYLKTILDRLDVPDDAAKSTIGSEAEYREVDRIFAGMGLTNKPHFFQFFARTHETLRPTYEMIRLGQMAQSQAVFAKLLNEVLSPEEESGIRRQVLDGSTMPEFEKVQHYFGKVGIYGVSEEDGYFIKGFTLERGQSNEP